MATLVGGLGDTVSHQSPCSPQPCTRNPTLSPHHHQSYHKAKLYDFFFRTNNRCWTLVRFSDSKERKKYFSVQVPQSQSKMGIRELLLWMELWEWLNRAGWVGTSRISSSSSSSPPPPSSTTSSLDIGFFFRVLTVFNCIFVPKFITKESLLVYRMCEKYC